MRFAALLVVTGLLAVVSLVGSPRADACGACFDTYATSAPADRREPVPVNARFLVSGPGLSSEGFDRELIDLATGASIPFTLEDAGDTAGAFWLVPDEPLPAGGEIALRDAEQERRFQVSTAIDETAPEAPEVELEERAALDACCPNTAVQLLATKGGDDDALPAAVLKVVVRSPAGERVALFGYRPGIREALGTSEEGCVATDPGAELDVEQEAFVSVLDWAGNESEAIGPIAFRYADVESPGTCPVGPACACATTTTRAPALGLAVLVGALVLMRRRRR